MKSLERAEDHVHHLSAPIAHLRAAAPTSHNTDPRIGVDRLTVTQPSTACIVPSLVQCSHFVLGRNLEGLFHRGLHECTISKDHVDMDVYCEIKSGGAENASVAFHRLNHP